MANSKFRGFLIKGRVQRAGFRAKVKEIAKKHGLIGFTKNLENFDEDVLVVCKNNGEGIEKFSDDIDELINEQKKTIKEMEELERTLSDITDRLDRKLTLKTYDKEKEPEDILMLLERKKSILRKLKVCKSTMAPYSITRIVPVEDIKEYEKEIKEYEEKIKNNFVLIRDADEASIRLDEGIEALIDLKHSTSSLNYDIIDTDFAILNTKYGALTKAISSGFKDFPTAFAKAFDVILAEKYDIRPKAKKSKCV